MVRKFPSSQGGERRVNCMVVLDDMPYARARSGSLIEHEGDKNFFVWPARVDDRRVTVWINTEELSTLACVPLSIDGQKIATALQNHRDQIERSANARFCAGDNKVVLDIGSLVSRA